MANFEPMYLSQNATVSLVLLDLDSAKHIKYVDIVSRGLDYFCCHEPLKTQNFEGQKMKTPRFDQEGGSDVFSNQVLFCCIGDELHV